MRKRIGSSILILTLVLSAVLTGCGAPKSDRIQIGTVQIIEHNALDAAYKGFVDALKDNGYIDGETVDLDFQNAQGDMNNLSTIADHFVSQKKDLVLAISTDAAQAMAGKTTEIPIVGTAITSYAIAGLVDSDETPGGNVTGTCDMNPVADQIDLLLELAPTAETIGLIYNAGEDNSALQVKIAKGRIEALGLQWVEVTVTNTGEVQQAMQSLVGRSQAVYIPTDNTLANAMATVGSVAAESKIPVVCGESNMAMEGGLASLGIDYYDLGYQTGMMAAEILGGADPAAMPIQYAAKSDNIIINAKMARDIGYEIPAQYQDAAQEPAA